MASIIRRFRRSVAKTLGLESLPSLRRVNSSTPATEPEPQPENRRWTHKVTLTSGETFGVVVEKGGEKAARAAAREHLCVSRLPAGTKVEAC